MAMARLPLHELDLGRARLVVLPECTYPMVHFVVSFAAGTVHNPAGQAAGLGLLLELLLCGTRLRPRLDFHRALEAMGSRLEVKAGATWGMVRGACLLQFLPQTLALLAEACLAPTLVGSELTKLQAQVRSDLLQERDDDEALAALFVRQLLYGTHPLARGVVGSMADVRMVDDAALQAARARLGAAELVLGIVGDIDLEAACRAFAPLLAAWPALAAPPDAPPVAMPAADMRVVVVDKPQRSQAQIRLAQLAPSAHDADADAFWLGAIAFGGTFTSPLTRQIRDERGWSYVAQADLARWAPLKAPLVLQAAPSLDDAPACLALILELYGELARGELEADVVEQTRTHVQRRHVFEVASAYDVLVPAVHLAQMRLPINRVWDLPERMHILTPAHVAATMARHLQPHGWVATIVAPARGRFVRRIERACAGASVEVVDYREGTEACP